MTCYAETRDKPIKPTHNESKPMFPHSTPSNVLYSKSPPRLSGDGLQVNSPVWGWGVEDSRDSVESCAANVVCQSENIGSSFNNTVVIATELHCIIIISLRAAICCQWPLVLPVCCRDCVVCVLCAVPCTQEKQQQYTRAAHREHSSTLGTIHWRAPRTS